MASPIEHYKTREAAFTLIELSIALVIIGLICGGILVGRDIVNAAHLRKTISQYEQILAGLNSFQATYNCLPGDCMNATRYWGRHSSITQDNCFDVTNVQWTAWHAAALQYGTCNGNGNGFFDRSNFAEQNIAWQHLSNAGLISGQYSGVKSFIDAPDIRAGTRYPLAALPAAEGVPAVNVFWMTPALSTMPFVKNGVNVTDDVMNSNKVIGLGSRGTNTTIGGGLTSINAAAIDTKIDDGKPTTGDVVARHYNPVCTTWPYVYNTANNGSQCSLLIFGGF